MPSIRNQVGIPPSPRHRDQRAVSCPAVREASNESCEEETEFDNDDSAFTIETIDSAEERDNYGNICGRPKNDNVSIRSNESSKGGPPTLLVRG